MAEVCDICGDVGVADAITPCYRCKTNQAHPYCMRVYCIRAPQNWCCEICEDQKEEPVLTVTTGPTNVTRPLIVKPFAKVSRDFKRFGEGTSQKHVGKSSVNWEKKVNTGRTRYIPVQEALKLPSGKTLTGSVPKSTWHTSPKRPAFRTQLKPITFPFKQPIVQQNQGKSSGQGQGQGQGIQLKKHNIQKEQHGNGFKNVGEGKKTEKKPEKVIAQSSRAGNEVLTDLEVKKSSDTEKVKMLSYCDPAETSTWKGSFEVVDSTKHGNEILMEAHTPLKTRKKVYYLSKIMPCLLQFQLIPRGDYFKSQEYSPPDKHQIGLYFFPSLKTERCEKYSSLLEYLVAKDLGMSMSIHGYQLLVFPSTLLDKNSQKWYGENYLWGIFVPQEKKEMKANFALRVAASSNGDEGLNKHDKDNEKKKFSGSTSVSNNTINSTKEESSGKRGEKDNNEVVDMEIDMVGGKEVGIKDIPIQKQELEFPPGFENKNNGKMLLGVYNSPPSYRKVRFNISPGPGIFSNTRVRHDYQVPKSPRISQW